MAYDQSVRKLMNNAGYADDKIGYDNKTGTVLYNGSPFLQNSKNYGGTSFTDQTSFDNANKAYKASQNPANVQQPTYNQQPSYNQQPATQPNNNDQIAQMLQAISSYGQNQPAFDPYNSAAYKAAQAQSQRQTDEAQRQSRENLNRRGIFDSSLTSSQANQIAQKGNEYLMTQVLPQIQAQEEARKQQEFQNLITKLQPFLNQQERTDRLAQNDISNRLAEAGLTGSYMSPEQESGINQMKRNSTDWFNASPELQQALAQENQRIGSQIGATQNEQGDWVYPQGTPTLEAQQIDRRNYESDRDYELAKGQQEWENAFKQGQFDENKAQQAWENAFKERDFAQSMKEAAAGRGLQWASLSQREKEFVADQAFREKQFEFEKEQVGNKPKNFEDNPEFAQDVADPDTAELLVSNPQAYIDAYGTKGYLELRKIFKIDN